MENKPTRTKKLIKMAGSLAVILPKEWVAIIGAKTKVRLALDAEKREISVKAEEG